MVQVGLLGAGRIGQVHAANIAGHGGSTLAAIADHHAPSAEALAGQYGAAARGSEEILADPGIDAIVIATSTETHCDLIEAAAHAGKAVFCEKPVDLSLDRARACQEATKDASRPIMIGFNRRFDANFAALHNATQAGEIGNSELLSITSYDPAPPPVSYLQSSGGLFRDMMIHDLDMANFLMGSLPVQVSAMASALTDPAIGEAGDVDTAVVTLGYEDGRIAVIKNSRRASYGYDQRVELLGSDGMLALDNVRESTLSKATAAGVQSAKPQHFFLQRYHQAYATEWAAFVSAVQQDLPAPVTLQDGVAALLLADAAHHAAQSGAPVKVTPCN